jgi:pSer/pThr/pTyr-binding forkhead associated (FHA) protein
MYVSWTWKSTVVVRDPQGRDTTYEIGEDGVEIGRAAECTIRIADPMLARRHARIEPRGERCWLIALSSAKTFLNRSPILEAEIHHNDVVQCGGTWLRYVEVSREDPFAPKHTGPLGGNSLAERLPITPSPARRR